MELGGDPLVYISNRAKRFIERYYTPCGLETQFLQMIEDLPAYLSSELGMDAKYWQKELDDPGSWIHRYNIMVGAIEYAVNQAQNLSEKTEAELCEYLWDSIERNWIGKWLAGYIKGMRV
ncbi:MAG: hypothetical protein RXS42_08570 [Nitrososphaeria archaeon]